MKLQTVELKTKGLALSQIMLAVALSAVIGVGITEYYENTVKTESNINNTAPIKAMSGQHYTNKNASDIATVIQATAPDGNQPSTNTDIKLNGQLLVDNTSFSKNGSTTYSSAGNNGSGTLNLARGNNSTVISNNAGITPSGIVNPAVGTATIRVVAPTVCTPSAPTPSISNVSVTYTYAPSGNPLDPPESDSGVASWTATLGAETKTITTDVNTGGTMNFVWNIGGYGYSSKFVCRWRSGERGGRGGGNSLQTWLICNDPVLNTCP